ncbi:hypothetical protein PHYBOEH_002843 [Phytophthora boehmeriae]|uniref:RxLR effector protein n=1 Tax=Phytophthora boehmeriae TaxID=109152 RepID=A0A8T1WPX7_9STRA|nr:hypothetical protein PHYBOEH_002843 [Phytophthora boehmeriae]
MRLSSVLLAVASVFFLYCDAASFDQTKSSLNLISGKIGPTVNRFLRTTKAIDNEDAAKEEERDVIDLAKKLKHDIRSMFIKDPGIKANLKTLKGWYLDKRPLKWSGRT